MTPTSIENWRDVEIKRFKRKYEQLADYLRAQILDGRLPHGSQMPSYAEIEAEFGFSQNTVQRAHAILESEGLIRREQGRGIFVESGRWKIKTGFVGYLGAHRSYANHSAYFRQVEDGVRQAANELGKHVVLLDSQETFSRWNELEGLLLCEVTEPNRVQLPSLLPDGLPVVNLLSSDPLYPSVRANDEAGIRLLVDHLHDLGHRRIAYVTRINDPLLRSRHQAYREALLRHGIEPDSSWSWTATGLGAVYAKFGYEMMSDWMHKGWTETGCTAILAQNDLMAHGIIKALAENGVSVPGDVSVVGFDGVIKIGRDGLNDEYLAPIQPTTIKVPLFEIGYTALKLLLGQNASPSETPAPICLPVELQQGESSTLCHSLNRSQEATVL